MPLPHILAAVTVDNSTDVLHHQCGGYCCELVCCVVTDYFLQWFLLNEIGPSQQPMHNIRLCPNNLVRRVEQFQQFEHGCQQVQLHFMQVMSIQKRVDHISHVLAIQSQLVQQILQGATLRVYAEHPKQLFDGFERLSRQPVQLLLGLALSVS